jgi:hypothetical protein
MDFTHPSTESLAWIYTKFCGHIVLIIATILFLVQINGYSVSSWFAKMPWISFIVSLTIAASIIMFVGSRNFYLPFLGSTVYPCGSLAEKVPADADTSVAIKVKPGANVVYWASEPTDPTKQPISNPWDAYALYDNSGVVRADSQGNATLRFRSPSSYKVGLVMGRTLKRHVHYRVCNHAGMMSDIKTVFI